MHILLQLYGAVKTKYYGLHGIDPKVDRAYKFSPVILLTGANEAFWRYYIPDKLETAFGRKRASYCIGRDRKMPQFAHFSSNYF